MLHTASKGTCAGSVAYWFSFMSGNDMPSLYVTRVWMSSPIPCLYVKPIYFSIDDSSSVGIYGVSLTAMLYV